jgi:peptide/nickel transport system ATP-binding protein
MKVLDASISPLKLPAGCSFRGRCPRGDQRCTEMPALTPLAPEHLVRCFHPHVEAAP